MREAKFIAMAGKTRFVTAPDGAHIAYDKCGGGPALMLLHGAGKTRKDWHQEGYVARLEREFTVIAVDIRGSGESEFLTEIGDYEIDKICTDLLVVANACEAGRFAIWGFSFGGNIARYLGARMDRVSAIAVVGVPFGPAVDEAFDRYIDEFISRHGELVQLFNKGELSEKERNAALKGRTPVWVACFQAMRHWPRVDPGDLRCPGLLLVGTKNENTLNWVEANQAALDTASLQVEVVEGLTHLQEFSQIDRVYPLIYPFLIRHARV